MLFIPIDVLNKKFSLLKHLALIMLHDYLHCLVFKEQSYQRFFRSACRFKRLIYLIAFALDCQELFNFSFLSKFESNLLQFLASQGLLDCVFCALAQRLVLYYTLYYPLSTLLQKKNRVGG